MVMGSRCPHAELVCKLRSKSVIHPLAFFILLTLVSTAAPRRLHQCLVDKCSKDYHSISSTTDETKKCRLLYAHRQCLTNMHVVCRGDLLYHTSVHINKRQSKNLHCANLLQDLSSSTTESPASGNHTGQNLCSYAGKPKYKFCSLFGDPHVRTFSDKFHTCKANGSWSLINNDYLVVMATNTYLDREMEATAISKISVIVKDSGDCAREKIYTADVDYELPSTFNDGTTHTGLEESVKVSEKLPGREVQIDVRFIATTLVIRHVGSHLSVSVQMPEEIVDSPVDKRPQMCVKGCPRRQRIPLAHEIIRLTKMDKFDVTMLSDTEIVGKYSEQEARRRCRDALLEDENANRHTERSKRSTGKSSSNLKNPRSINNRPHKNTDLDPAATTWQLLSGSSKKSHGDESKMMGSPHSMLNGKSRRRSANRKKSKHKRPSNMMNDDPRPHRKRGKTDRKNPIASVSRGSNFYFEACVFDLMTTGDVMYATSARGAFDDVIRFHESGSKAPLSSRDAVNSWTPQPTTKPLTNLVKTQTPETDAPLKMLPTTDSGNSATHGPALSLVVFIISIFFSLCAPNLVHAGVFFGLNNNFFKLGRVTT